MFNCSECKQTVGPKVGAIHVVIGTRDVAYHNEYFVEDEWGNQQKREVDSRGIENTGERLVCPACAKENVTTNASSINEWGGKGFREKLAEPLRVKLVASAISSALDRLGDKSKRAKRDTETAVPLIKRFTDDNKQLVF